MTAFMTHFNFEFRTGIRNKNLLLMTYLFPLGFYLMMGFIMPTINPPFQEAMIPAMITFTVLAATLLGLPESLVQARELGIFRSYKINGVPALSILLVSGLTASSHLIIISLLITLSAPVLFGAKVPANAVSFLITIMALAVASTGIGLLIGVMAPSSRLTVMYSQAIFVPSILLGGLMMPFDILPEAARLVAQLFPATHAMNAFYELTLDKTAIFNPWASIIILFAGGLLAYLLALYLFRWDSKNSLRRGPTALALLALTPYLVGLLLL